MKIKHLIAIIIAAVGLLPCLAQKHQHGKASFYSKRATGARSASGQKIHHDSLTCAHRYYPFGTHLKVTNLSNNKSVVVEVIDRGPYGRGRIIDLSWAAANKIGMIAQGIATVKIELAERPIPYRPEETKMPKLEFDIAEFEPKNNYDFSKKKKANQNDAQKQRAEEKGHEGKKGNNASHDNNKNSSQHAYNKNMPESQEKSNQHNTQNQNSTQKQQINQKQQTSHQHAVDKNQNNSQHPKEKNKK